MNLENMARLTAAIKAEIYEFDMGTWRWDTSCGTAACIGGHCEILLNKPRDSAYMPFKEAANWLGLDEAGAQELFYPEELKFWHLITREDAVTALQNVIAFGTPRWTEIRPDLVVQGGMNQ